MSNSDQDWPWRVIPIEKTVKTPGTAEPEPFDPRNYKTWLIGDTPDQRGGNVLAGGSAKSEDKPVWRTSLPPSAWRSIGSSAPPARWDEVVRNAALDHQNDPTFSIMLGQLTDVCNQRDDALAEIARLTEERDNARANAEHFATLLNQRTDPKPEPSLTPDGALSPIPRDSALGNTLAALRSAKDV